MAVLFGSINLSNIPKDQIKQVTLKDGTTAKYLNVVIGELKTPRQYDTKEGRRKTIDHYIGVKDEEKNMTFIGDLSEWKQQGNAVTPDDVASAPVASDDDGLPF